MNIDMQVYFERFQKMVISTSSEAGQVTLILIALIIIAMLIDWQAMAKALDKAVDHMRSILVLTPPLFLGVLVTGTGLSHIEDIGKLSAVWVGIIVTVYVTLMLLQGVAITMNTPQKNEKKARPKQDDALTT